MVFDALPEIPWFSGILIAFLVANAPASGDRSIVPGSDEVGQDYGQER
jgi:hypothetical protein